MNLRLISAAAACLLLPTLAIAADDSQLTLGGGVAAGARYSGSKQNAVAPVIVIDYTHASGFFASTLRGIGYGGQGGPLTYSAALGYRGERKEKNEKGLFGNTGSSGLKGMGDIKGSANAMLSLGYKPVSMLELNVSADIPLSQRENGKTFHSGVTAQLLDAPADQISLGVGAGFADSKYAQTYYGVTAKQAATSKFKAYQAKSGLYEANIMLTWQHKLDQKWAIATMVGATHLLREASRSPLTERKTSPSAAVYVSYAY